MTNTTRRFRIYILTQCILAFLLAGMVMRGRAAIPPTEQLLPADTLLVVCVPDMAKSREIFKQSPTGQLIHDPAMKPFCDKFTQKFHEEFLDPLQRDLGINLADFAKLAQGQMVLAITQNGWMGQGGTMPGGLFLMDSRDKSSQLRKMLADLRKNWMDAGKSVRTEKVRDVDFSVVEVSTNDVPKTLKDFFPQHQDVQELGSTPPKPAPKSELYVGQYESLLVVGDSAKTVDKVIARLTGGSAPALADDAEFEADQLALMRDAQSYVWFNAKKFFDVIISLPPAAPNPDAPSLTPQLDFSKLLPALGLSGLKTVAVSSHYGDGGLSFEIFIGAPESTRQGLFKLVAAETKESSPPGFVPVDVAKFQRWRFDGQKSIATMEKMLGDISPQALNMWNFFINTGTSAEQERNPDFDLRKDVFGNLGDDLIVYTKAPQASVGGLPQSLILIGSPNAEKLAGSLKAALALVSPTAVPRQREFLGHHIYTIDLPSRSVQPGADGAAALNYAASGGYVALSTDAGILEEYLRSSDGQTKPLRDLPGLQDAAQQVGGENTGQFSYENLSVEARILFTTLKTVAKAEAGSGASFNPLAGSIPFASPAKSMKEWLDFSLLPDFDAVSKYFSFSVSSGSTTPDGLAYKVFMPDPPNLKQ